MRRAPAARAQPPVHGRPPRCAACGNLRRPAVVWFGEMLPMDVLAAAEEAATALRPDAGGGDQRRRLSGGRPGARARRDAVVVVNPAAERPGRRRRRGAARHGGRRCCRTLLADVTPGSPTSLRSRTTPEQRPRAQQPQQVDPRAPHDHVAASVTAHSGQFGHRGSGAGGQHPAGGRPAAPPRCGAMPCLKARTPRRSRLRWPQLRGEVGERGAGQQDADHGHAPRPAAASGSRRRSGRRSSPSGPRTARWARARPARWRSRR